jgi:sortase A
VVPSPLCDDKWQCRSLLPQRCPTPRTRRLSALAVLMILVGALALLDAVVTLVWQEPISALYATLRQDHLSGALSKVEHAAPTPVERRALASLRDERARIAFLAGELERHAGNGSPVGRIVIPELGASYVVVNGTDTEDLKSGPGIYAETSFPGISGTTAIAGHRTTYLAPFRNIDALEPGNHILVHMPYARFTYTVTAQRVVAPSDVQAAVANVGYTRLVLSACTPLFSAEKRLLVYARSKPGRARRCPPPRADLPSAPSNEGARIPRSGRRLPARLPASRRALPSVPRRSS